MKSDVVQYFKCKSLLKIAIHCRSLIKGSKSIFRNVDMLVPKFQENILYNLSYGSRYKNYVVVVIKGSKSP